MCAAIFMRVVRGLPLDEMEIDSCGKIYKVLCDKDEQKFRILMPKCKLLSSNITVSVDKMPILVSLIKIRDEIFSVTECSDSKYFSHSSLKRIYNEMRSFNVSGVVAFSVSGESIGARGFFPCDSDDRTIDTALCAAFMAERYSTYRSIRVTVADTAVICEDFPLYTAVSGDYVAQRALVSLDIF